jgi:hypothetical protein
LIGLLPMLSARGLLRLPTATAPMSVATMTPLGEAAAN